MTTEQQERSEKIASRLAGMLKSLDEGNEMEITYKHIRRQEFTECLKQFLAVNCYFDPPPRAGFTDSYIYDLTKQACEADPLFDSLLERQEELTEDEEAYVKVRIGYFKHRVKLAVKYYTDLKAQS